MDTSRQTALDPARGVLAQAGDTIVIERGETGFLVTTRAERTGCRLAVLAALTDRDDLTTWLMQSIPQTAPADSRIVDLRFAESLVTRMTREEKLDVSARALPAAPEDAAGGDEPVGEAGDG